MAGVAGWGDVCRRGTARGVRRRGRRWRGRVGRGQDPINRSIQFIMSHGVEREGEALEGSNNGAGWKAAVSSRAFGCSEEKERKEVILHLCQTSYSKCSLPN